MTTPAAQAPAIPALPRATTSVSPPRGIRIPFATRAWTTPQLLTLALAGAWVLVAIVFLLARSGLSSDVRAAAQTIGHDSEPSVLYARQIGLSQADMHASVANAFLLGPGNDTDAWRPTSRSVRPSLTTWSMLRRTSHIPVKEIRFRRSERVSSSIRI